MQIHGFRGNRGGSISVGQSRRTAATVKNVLLLILVAALAASLIIGIPAIRAKEAVRTSVVDQMNDECGNAQYALSRLSNAGSSSTYEQLAKIRSRIYAIDILNQTYRTASGQQLIPNDQFATLYTLIDDYYDTLLRSSTNTSGVLMQLRDSVDILLGYVNSLK